MTTVFLHDIKAGDRFALGGYTYTAKGDARVVNFGHSVFVNAVRPHPALGTEMADVLERAGTQVERHPDGGATISEAPRHTAFAAFQAADDAWQAALVAAWGESHAAEARYLPSGRGEDGTPLRAAYEAREAARIAWEGAA